MSIIGCINYQPMYLPLICGKIFIFDFESASAISAAVDPWYAFFLGKICKYPSDGRCQIIFNIHKGGTALSVTIKEIAEYTGTSRGTVDKVIHDRPGVKPETRQKIQEAIEALNYQPNIIGKALVLKNNPIKIGIIVSPDYNYYIQQVMLGIHGAEQEYAPFGIKVDVHILHSLTAEEELILLNKLESDDYAGIGVFPFDDIRIRDKLNALSDSGIAIVTFNSQVDDLRQLCFIGQDHYQAGRAAGSLIQRIITPTDSVAVLISSMNISCHEQRLKGFSDKLTENSPQIRIVDVMEEYDDDQKSYDCTLDLCRRYPELSAIYITSGGSVGVCKALKELHMEEKIKVISHDMSPQALPYLKTGLIAFSIEQNGYDQGYQVVKVLFEYLIKCQKCKEPFIQAPLKVITEELI